MFSKAESKQLRQDFWIAFGKSYPRKWILYRTKVKGLSFKFDFGLKYAQVSLDVDAHLEKRILLWEKLCAFQSIFKEDYCPDAIFEDYFILDNQKEISRIYARLAKVSIHNKNTWQETMIFFNSTMDSFERFYLEYEDSLRID